MKGGTAHNKGLDAQDFEVMPDLLSDTGLKEYRFIVGIPLQPPPGQSLLNPPNPQGPPSPNI
jgi:hypothetical protein